MLATTAILSEDLWEKQIAVRRTLPRLASFLSRLWSTALLSCLPIASARALDLTSDNNRLDETVAYQESMKTYDSSIKLGASRVEDIRRKPFSPDGIRFGNILTYPSIGTSLVFDNNVLQTNANRRSDIRAEITPELRLKSDLPRHQFDLSLGGKIVEYSDNPDLNHSDAYIKANAALHFDHAHTLSMSAMSKLDHQDKLDPFSPTLNRNLVSVFRNEASVGLTRDAGRLYGTVSAFAKSADYSNTTSESGAVIELNSRDTRIFGGEVKVGYRFSPGFELITKFRGLRQFMRGDGILDADSNGYEGLVGLSFQTSPLLRWRLMGGYGIRDYDSATLGTLKTSLAEADVEWLVTPALTLYGTARRAISDDVGVIDGTTSGLVETGFKVRAEYEIWHNIVLGAQAEFKDQDYLGSQRHDVVTAGKVGVDWFAAKNWQFGVAYERLIRNSNQPLADVTRDLFSVSAKLKF